MYIASLNLVLNLDKDNRGIENYRERKEGKEERKEERKKRKSYGKIINEPRCKILNQIKLGIV